MTYQEYSKLKKSPSVPELKELIIEKDPITEMYSCPDLKHGSDIKTMNELVKSDFKACQKIK